MSNRSNTLNPNNRAFIAARINRGNQLNRCHSSYHSSRLTRISSPSFSSGFGSTSYRQNNAYCSSIIFDSFEEKLPLYATHTKKEIYEDHMSSEQKEILSYNEKEDKFELTFDALKAVLEAELRRKRNYEMKCRLR